MDYNKSNLNSIIAYAKKLENKSLRIACGVSIENYSYRGKGNFGQLLEKYYFNYEPNSLNEPDFHEVELELKSSPLKVLKSNQFRSKERLVLNIINYLDLPKQDFLTSSFYVKNSHLLLVFYLHEQDVDVIDYIIKLVGDWKIPDTDLSIIKNDWEQIKKKVLDGLAHELSEGDTFYLGAATKGAKGGNFRTQPFNNLLAKQRAFTFKQGYLNHIIASLAHDKKDVSYGKIISSSIQLNNKTLEEIVVDKFSSYLNKSVEDLVTIFSKNKLNPKAKNFYSSLAKLVLGISIEQEIEEFSKAEIKVKAIRIKNNNLPKEDLSFPAFNYEDLVNEDWEESIFKSYLETKYIFIFFKFDKNDKLTLNKVKFWNMPVKDIIDAKKVWVKTKQIVNNGDIVNHINKNIRHTNFPNKEFNRVSHVRPHALNSKDTFPLPVTDKVTKAKEYTKHSFWINNTYIRDNIFLLNS
jgi:DNA mismatch repair protein MutH